MERPADLSESKAKAVQASEKRISMVPADADSRSAVEARVKEAIFRAEGYRYNRSKAGATSCRLICTQRSDSARSTSHDENQKKRRRRDSMKMKSCNGVLTLKFSAGGPTVISCFHEYIHESVPHVSQITSEISDAIQRGVDNGLSPFQIVSDLNNQKKGQFTWSQVYYKWSSIMESRYKSSPDVKVSSQAFLAKSGRFSQVYYAESPFALGFISNHARAVCTKAWIQEAYIDSTFKTNSSKLDLFAILGSFLGTGFPIAYLFLEIGGRGRSSECEQSRKNSIKGFLGAVYRELQSFRPIFFFTDKDFGQISGLSDIYGILPSICLWHMKRAVKRKIGALKAEGLESLTKEHMGDILDLITKHFNTHPFFYAEVETVQSLYLKNLQ